MIVSEPESSLNTVRVLQYINRFDAEAEAVCSLIPVTSVISIKSDRQIPVNAALLSRQDEPQQRVRRCFQMIRSICFTTRLLLAVV